MPQLQAFNALVALLLAKLAKTPLNALVVLPIILYMMQPVSNHAQLNSTLMVRVYAINAMDIAKLAPGNIIA